MAITATQCKMARAVLGWGIRELARRAGVSQATVNRFERELSQANAATVAVIQRALEEGGAEFLNGDGVRLRKRR